MGYRMEGAIRSFWPDDDEKTIYRAGECSLEEILELIAEKWPDATPDQITITGEKIHTDCLTYDRYDSGDYTDFIVITHN